jgi:hypothetical protein
MAADDNVLSLNPDGQKLARQEVALRESGFRVVSVATPLQARFEIEMGRCGIFLTSDITPTAIYRDLADVFKRNCPQGLVVFLTNKKESVPAADVVVSAEDEPRAIVRLIQEKLARNAN